MKKCFAIILGILLMTSISSLAIAEEVTYPPETMQKLLGCKYKIHALEDLEKSEVITPLQAKTGTDEYLKKAQGIASSELTLGELLMLEPIGGQAVELTALQKFAGKITLINTIWIFAICAGVFSFCYLVIQFFPRVFEWLKYIPMEAYEFAFYLLSIGFMFGGFFLSKGVGPFVSLTGCLGLAGAQIFSMHIRKREIKEVRFFAILCAIYIPIALLLQSQLIGFIAVIALMGALGFSGAVIPCGFAIGFKDEDALARATSTAFLILIGFVIIRILGYIIPYLQVFEKGALFMGSFVGYLGLLIASSRWYTKRTNWLFMQGVMLVACIAALAIGSIFQIGELKKIGGTFFGLWMIEKPFEIPAESATQYAVITLVVSILVFLGCWYAKANPAIISPYVLYPF